MCRHDDPPEIVATTAGRALPGVELRVLADGASDVPRGEAGEVLVRGYNLMLEYLSPS